MDYPPGSHNDPNAPYNERQRILPSICDNCETDNPEWEYFDEEHNFVVVQCRECHNRIHV